MMEITIWPGFVCGLILLQAIGLMSAWLARISEGSKGQTPFQWLFFGCLALVGGVTIMSLGLPPGTWLSSGATLSMMVLAAVWDFSSANRRGSTALD